MGTYRHKWVKRTGVAGATPVKGIARRLRAAGIPTVSNVTPEEEALALLDVASEIEHGLMVEYLYAAYASSNNTIRSTLSNIAKQEMGHLITVQNLILMLGGKPYLGRQDQTPNESEDPFPFELQPPSLPSLAMYSSCEAPPADLVPAAQAALYAEVTQLAAMTVPFVNRVGALYAKLYWMFMDDDQTVDVWTGFPVDEFQLQAGRHVREPASPQEKLQSDIDEWPGSVDDLQVTPCLSRKDARAAIFAIAAQGEGGPHGISSHFDRFLAVYELAKATPLFAHDVPTSPTLVTSQPGTIDHQRAVPLVKVGDSFYRLVILQMLLGLTYERTESIRSELLDASRTDMTTALRRIAAHLSGKVPRRAGQADTNTAKAAAVFARPSVVRGDRSTLRGAFGVEIGLLEAALNELKQAPNDPVAAAMVAVFEAFAAEKRNLHQRI